MRFNVLGRSNALAFQVVFMMAMTSLALFIGVSPIFGAFVSGILAGTLSGNQEGKSTVSIDAARAQASIQSFSFAFFVPIYFAIVGLKLDLIRDFNIPFFALFLVYACVVKALSIYAGARLAGEKREGAIHLAMVSTPVAVRRSSWRRSHLTLASFPGRSTWTWYCWRWSRP